RAAARPLTPNAGSRRSMRWTPRRSPIPASGANSALRPPATPHNRGYPPQGNKFHTPPVLSRQGELSYLSGGRLRMLWLPHSGEEKGLGERAAHPASESATSTCPSPGTRGTLRAIPYMVVQRLLTGRRAVTVGIRPPRRRWHVR